MKPSLILWQIGGFTFTAVLGTILHFVYEWTGVIYFAPFSAVNESTWEHMKIMFFPSFIYALIEYFALSKNYSGFMITKLLGVITSVILIPVLFYTLSGSFGKLAGYINVIIFFVSGGIWYLIEYFILKNKLIKNSYTIISLIIFTFIAVCFIVFTFYPPKIPIFIDPRLKLYAIY